MDRELIVRGVGEVRAMPDVASVRVSIDGEGQSRDEAYQMASSAAAAVDGVLADFDTAIDRVNTAALAVQPKTRWRKGETQRTGWHALRESVIEITDTSRVGDILNGLAGAGANISDLSWMVAMANESFALARQRAGQDAKARAEQYAQALNIKLGPVAWASEPGLRVTGQMDWMSAAPGGARAMSAGLAEEPIAVNPEEVTISAALEVAYSISEDA
ncbi:MAG TPA: SIMPL domain-containing protein [Streptosporangiaceae bacterium]|nr:SIMPL domain-containing protein [Streptosporangiaceae bacterium]